MFRSRSVIAFGLAYVVGLFGAHVEACRERARHIRQDLAQHQWICEKYGCPACATEIPVFYWYGLRYLKESEARLEQRAATLRRFSPVHRIYDVLPKFE